MTTLLPECASQLRLALSRRPPSPSLTCKVVDSPAILEVTAAWHDEEGEVVQVRAAQFGALPGSLQIAPPSQERLERWAAAFVRYLASDDPSLYQAAPALLYRPELDIEEALFQAMQDPDYSHFATQILEAEGTDEERMVAAVIAGNWLWVADLLAANPALASIKPYGETLVSLARENEGPGTDKVLKILRQHRRSRPKKQKSPSAIELQLMTAAMRGDTEAAKAAIEAGAMVDAQDAQTGASALHEAAMGGHLAIVELLLGAPGANVDLPMKRSNTTPLGCAISGGHIEIVGRLLAAGAQPNVRYDRGGQTPLSTSAAAGNPELVSCLLAHGSDVNATTGAGLTALETAVMQGHDLGQASRFGAVIRHLVAAGADPGTPNAYGQSAIDLAHSLGRDHLLPFLEVGR